MHYTRCIKYTFISLFVLMFALTSCTEEDDIESIFSDRTWYVSGLNINGSNANGDDIKSIYTVSESYFIHFSSNNTFSGILVNGSSLSGKWDANGKDKSISLHFTEAVNVESTTLSANIYRILTNVSSYSGDENNIELRQNRTNFVRMSNRKKI